MENRLSFGLDAAAYRKYRPHYPRTLFEYLASMAADTRSALDCATGTGQSAVGLAEFFDRVAAFDPSPEQIAAAIPADNIEYRVGSAEDLPFDAEQFDLVTAAQAAHWFNLPTFYEQLAAVTRPGSLIAIWGYSYCRVDPVVDRVVEQTLLDAIAPYWAEGNRVIVERYRGIPFPFEELDWPRFLAPHAWSRDGYMQYLRTWSAVKRLAREQGADPVARLERALDAVWPAAESRPVEFEFVGRLGRVKG